MKIQLDRRSLILLVILGISLTLFISTYFILFVKQNILYRGIAANLGKENIQLKSDLENLKENQLNYDNYQGDAYTVDWASSLLEAEDYGNYEIKSYLIYPLGDYLAPGMIVISAHILDKMKDALFKYPNITLASPNNFYGVDSVFEVVDDSIYVINTINNTLDEYRLYAVDDELDFVYQRSYRLPGYETGILYKMSCENEVCTVHTGFHLEAGCDILFYPSTKEFSIPQCSGIGGPLELKEKTYP